MGKEFISERVINRLGPEQNNPHFTNEYFHERKYLYFDYDLAEVCS